MWEVISAISGLATILVMLFIEWPRIHKRWQETLFIRKRLFLVFYWGFVVMGFFLLQLGIWPGEQLPIMSDNIVGQVGLWIYTISLTLWAINITIRKPKAILKDLLTLFTMIVFLITVYANIWVYYFSGLIT